MLLNPPIPFANICPLVEALGFTMTHMPSEWEDVGGPESGPHIVGHGEFDLWTKGNMEIIVVDGMLVEFDIVPPEPEDIPF